MGGHFVMIRLVQTKPFDVFTVEALVDAANRSPFCHQRSLHSYPRLSRENTQSTSNCLGAAQPQPCLALTCQVATAFNSKEAGAGTRLSAANDFDPEPFVSTSAFVYTRGRQQLRTTHSDQSISFATVPTWEPISSRYPIESGVRSGKMVNREEASTALIQDSLMHPCGELVAQTLVFVDSSVCVCF